MKVSHIPPFGVRMPPDLKEKIEMASKKSGRSMNAEVVYRLQQSFDAVLSEMVTDHARRDIILRTKIHDALT